GKVAALDLDLLHFGAGEGQADIFLDHFGGGFADQHAVVAADVVDDRLVELVAAHAHGAGIDHTAQRDDAHFRRAAADVYHHRTFGFRHRQVGADGSRHGLFDQINLRGACADGRLADGATLHLGRTAGDTDDDARAG